LNVYVYIVVDMEGIAGFVNQDNHRTSREERHICDGGSERAKENNQVQKMTVAELDQCGSTCLQAAAA